MRFTRLKLGNWRNFKRAEVHLANRAFFVGPNASGKSNLIDAFRFLAHVASDLGGLNAAVKQREGVSALRCLQATRNSDISLEVDVGDDANPSQWTYKLVFNARRGEQPLVRSEQVWESGVSQFERPNELDKSDEALLSQTFLQQIQQNQRFRPLADFLRSTRYLHLVPQIVRNRALSSLESDPYGAGFLLAVKQTPKRARDAMLKRLNDGLKLAVPQFDGLTYEDDEEGRPHLIAKYHHWRPHPVGQSEVHFSDGTLRLLGLLWAAAVREPGPLLLEEPELSLHDAIVEQLVPMLTRMQRRSKRQLIVTTHSEVLINAPGLGLDEVHRLVPTKDGTIVETATGDDQVRALVEAGLEVGSAIMPKVRPTGIDQLSLFDVAG
ncbi:MAG: AAA family ATPase [Hyphomicrobiaceae bacterium]|nr:AAA family ATPase [Hyphomicrobiaceae bacterium]